MTTGAAGATTSGVSRTACRTSESSKPTRPTPTTSTEPTAPSSATASSPKPGSPPPKRSTSPASTTDSRTAQTTTDPDSTGVGPLRLNNPNGIRWSTNLGYLSLSRHRLNLTIRPNCNVHRIEFDGDRATGVTVESGGEVFTVQGDEIILKRRRGRLSADTAALRRRPRRPPRRDGHSAHQRTPRSRQEPARPSPSCTSPGGSSREHEFDLNGPRMQFGLRYTAAGSDLRNDMIVYMNTFATERINRGGRPHEPHRRAHDNRAGSRGRGRRTQAELGRPLRPAGPRLQLLHRGVRPREDA